MKRRWLRYLFAGGGLILVLGYIVIAATVARIDVTAPAPSGTPAALKRIAIFGASGTAGDGILKAALADPAVTSIQVITRRTTPRIDAGVRLGKVSVTTHLDYLDYRAVSGQIADVDAVFWAIGLSSWGVDEDSYRRIHVEFPQRFLEHWLTVMDQDQASLHYISSSDISAESSAMWARVKVEAEQTLFDLAAGTPVRVIAYRPDYIGPTSEEAHLGQRLVYAFFAPLGAAVKAEEIGRAMLEVARRGSEFENGAKIGTFGIRRMGGSS